MKKYPIILIAYLTAYSFFISAAFAKSGAAIVAEANKAYKAAKYDDALRLYNEALISIPDSPEINFNMGAAHFKKEDYENAIKHFEKAAVTGNKSLESKVNYNIGNSKYKLGKLKENTDLENTVKLFQESLDYYKRAIELNSKNKRAKLNHELVEKELKTLLDKIKRQGKNGQKKEQGEKQEQNDKNEKTESAGQENKPQEEKSQQDLQTQARSRNQEEQINDREKKDTQRPESEQSNSTQTEGQEMNEREAGMLLENYGQEENTRGKVRDNINDNTLDVLKDW